MTWNQYQRLVQNRIVHYGERAGQAAFNVLWNYVPSLAEKVRGTDNDPFYDNLKLGQFYEWVFPRLT